MWNGELTIEAPNGWREYYVLTYTGTKQPAGHVFNVKMVDTDMIEISGKVTIRQYGDESKTQPYIMVKAISPNLKKRLINNSKLMMVFTNGAGIPWCFDGIACNKRLALWYIGKWTIPKKNNNYYEEDNYVSGYLFVYDRSLC